MLREFFCPVSECPTWAWEMFIGEFIGLAVIFGLFVLICLNQIWWEDIYPHLHYPRRQIWWWRTKWRLKKFVYQKLTRRR